MVPLKKELDENVLIEINKIQQQLTRSYKETKEIALSHAKKSNENNVACSICGNTIPELCVSKLCYQVHAELHSLDKSEYHKEGNLHIICSRACHNQYNEEQYRLRDGKIVKYLKLKDK